MSEKLLKRFETYKEAKVEFRDYVFRPHIRYYQPLNKLELEVEKVKLENASYEYENYEPHISGKDVFGAKCGKLFKIVVNPKFAQELEKFGKMALVAVVAHEYAEAKSGKGKLDGQQDPREGLKAEVKVLGKEKAIELRKWFSEQYGADVEDDIEFIKKLN